MPTTTRYPDGETGRRVRLKISCSKGRAGSSPAPGTLSSSLTRTTRRCPCEIFANVEYSQRPGAQMRTVRDPRGTTWICLELPEVPIDQREAAAVLPADTVAIECNSGAERVIALVAPGWDDDMDDMTLSKTIAEFMQ